MLSRCHGCSSRLRMSLKRMKRRDIKRSHLDQRSHFSQAKRMKHLDVLQGEDAGNDINRINDRI